MGTSNGSSTCGMGGNSMQIAIVVGSAPGVAQAAKNDKAERSVHPFLSFLVRRSLRRQATCNRPSRMSGRANWGR